MRWDEKKNRTVVEELCERFEEYRRDFVRRVLFDENKRDRLRWFRVDSRTSCTRLSRKNNNSEVCHNEISSNNLLSFRNLYKSKTTKTEFYYFVDWRQKKTSLLIDLDRHLLEPVQTEFARIKTPIHVLWLFVDCDCFSELRARKDTSYSCIDRVSAGYCKDTSVEMDTIDFCIDEHNVYNRITKHFNWKSGFFLFCWRNMIYIECENEFFAGLIDWF